MTFVGWDELRLTREESDEIVSRRQPDLDDESRSQL
jgi:hypothetical protein